MTFFPQRGSRVTTPLCHDYLDEFVQLSRIDTGVLGNECLLLDHNGGPLWNLMRLLQGFEHGGSDDQIEDNHQENRGDRLPFHNINGRVTLHPGSKHCGFRGKREPRFGVLSGRFRVQQVRCRHWQQQRRKVRSEKSRGASLRAERRPTELHCPPGGRSGTNQSAPTSSHPGLYPGKGAGSQLSAAIGVPDGRKKTGGGPRKF